MSEWSPSQSAELYQVSEWGAGFFSVSPEGNLRVHPRLDQGVGSGLEDRKISEVGVGQMPTQVFELVGGLAKLLEDSADPHAPGVEEPFGLGPAG